jgi:hypothetical protein
MQGQNRLTRFGGQVKEKKMNYQLHKFAVAMDFVSCRCNGCEHHRRWENTHQLLESNQPLVKRTTSTDWHGDVQFA